MDPRPTTYNACKKGREKGFKAACITTCASILGEDGGAVELKSKSNPKPNSFAACDGSKNKKRRPNNPFARCRRAYEVAFEETQKGIAERALATLASSTDAEQTANATLAAALNEVNTDELEAGVEAEEAEEKDGTTDESLITEDVELRQLEEPEEERPTSHQVPPTDIVVEEAVEAEAKDSSAKEEKDVAVVESTTNIAEAGVEEPITAEAAAIVDESNDSGPIGSEAILEQPYDARANGPTGPVANKELPKEESATDDDTIGPTGAENTYHDYSPPGMNGPKETVSGSLSSDNDDNDDDAIDADVVAATPSNHVSVDLETSPIVE